MKRRNFFKTSAVASGTLLVPAFLQGFTSNVLTGSRTGKNLVVIQLSGGNDGLNTIIPFENDIYYQSRPQLAIPKKEVLKVSADLGFHPALSPLRKLYDAGEMTIINSVGYPNPDRSHFRSMDIWQTASGSESVLSTGWLGRYLDNDCLDCVPYHALEVDEGLSLAMKGAQRNGFAMSNVDKIKKLTRNRFLQTAGKTVHPTEDGLAYLYKTLTDTQNSAEYLAEKAATHRSTITYPRHDLAKNLKQIAELMTADTATKVYYVTLAGFDTHAGQKSKQQRLLTQYAESVKAFTDDLKSNGLFDDTLIMTFSEFGRRVKQNAGGGTDHGTASNVYLAGGKLKKAGFYNAPSDLSALQNGDLVHEIDFRHIYATILEDWLEADAGVILGGDFAKLGFI